MTTRAGWAGLLTGLVLTLVIYPLFTAWTDSYRDGGAADAAVYAWMGAAAAVILVLGGGGLAARGSGSTRPWRGAVLGGLAGGLAGAVLFCLWGAAAAGWLGWAPLFGQVTHGIRCQQGEVEIIGTIVLQTEGMFLALFLGGCALGALGGWLACPRRAGAGEVFNKAGPQMALNVTIAAVPASVVAAALAAAIFPRLANFAGGPTRQSLCAGVIVDLPLAAALLLVVVSHLALTLVIPHEAQQAEHLCGMDEVKMGAFVGIGAAPVLMLLVLLVEAQLFVNPLVITALVVCTGLSLKSLYALFKLILPGRAAFPAPQEGWQKTEASLFGSIATSSASQLVMLCTGCGLVIVLPIYIPVLSVLINLANLPAGKAYLVVPDLAWGLFLTQALVSVGLTAGVIVVLAAIYLFYMNLGRWFSQWNAPRVK